MEPRPLVASLAAWLWCAFCGELREVLMPMTGWTAA
jgi:hypothetical protein